MWPDFERLALIGDGSAPAFAFPLAEGQEWRLQWQAVVGQLQVTSDVGQKEALLDAFAYGRGPRSLGFVNAHALNSAVSDPHFADDLLALDHIVRDGVGVIALYRLLGITAGLNLNGTDLLPELLGRFAGKRVALFGTRQPIVDRAAGRLKRELGCDVITADGFQRDGHYLTLVAENRPDLVILGMGMPKQERVARQLKHGLDQDVAIVCGGAILDFMAGHVPRAPSWVRQLGLEWAFRLSREPKRLFGRYVIGNPLFLLRSLILAAWPKPAASKPHVLRDRRPPTDAFGIGGPALSLDRAANLAPARREPIVVPFTAPVVVPQTVASPAPAPAAIAPALAGAPRPPAGTSAESVFSANRPVVARTDLFGRQADLDHLLGWVLDQHGNALVYGPRGYGKTSLVRVFGEIADQRGHVVLYASGSRNVDFAALIRPYLAEIADNGLLPPPGAEAVLTVQTVATLLAGIAGASVVLIIDEFDRIERDDTRHDLIELIKDVSDLTASVRFVLVGVATDATAILGYHPSIQRCISCVALARLDPPAVADMFSRKAAIDGLDVGAEQLAAIVDLTAGSAYHAQLIGQKLVAQARRSGRFEVDADALDQVIDAILSDAVRIDAGFARSARAMRDPGTRSRLLQLAMLALRGADDLVELSDDANRHTLQALCLDLVADGVLQPADSVRSVGAYRFANAFLPQLIMMIQYRSRGLYSVIG